MNDPTIFFRVGNRLVNLNYVVSVIEDIFPVSKEEYTRVCTIKTVDGQEFQYHGTKEEFINGVRERTEKVGM